MLRKEFMKKVAIVGVEGSGKTVMLAGLGDLYTYPDDEGYFLAPKNFGTAAYVAEKIARMRRGEWPVATAGDEMQGLDWTLGRQKDGGKGRPENVCEVSFLDFPGEVYRAAYGISSGDDASLKDQVEELKQYVRGADDLIVLINLRDVITNGIGDRRVQEAMWITKAILDTALGVEAGKDTPRAAIVLSQADSYEETIKACGGAPGVLRRWLPYVANSYGWLDVFDASAVDKTALDGDGNMVPASDFSAKGLLPIMRWIRGEEVSDGGGGQDAAAKMEAPHTGGSRSCATVTGTVTAAKSEHKKVQLWKDGPYWAETNIGAENPWDSGYYFWWGDTVGYKREASSASGWLNRFLFGNEAWVASDGSSSGFLFREDDVPTCNKDFSTLCREGWITADRVLAPGGILTPKHDAAHVQWGGDWRMPTAQELTDLCKRCDWTWTSMNGVKGYVVRGRDDYSSASIFLPAAGNSHGPLLDNAGSNGYYWSSVPGSDYYGNLAWCLYFLSSVRSTGSNFRYGGRSVRPVQGFTK